ncbi:MAG TPA: WhiB family transcriptional regulator [Acidimicrobiales bacterium]|nr:WhiB family transcriptional regulator [Acidimicrobiales bacterium]
MPEQAQAVPLSASLAAVLKEAGWDLSDAPPERPPWHGRAACRGKGNDAFFPATDDRRPSAQKAYAQALMYCRACPVINECRRAGQHEMFGLWGGLSPSQRKRSGPHQAQEVPGHLWHQGRAATA